jgi:fucose permease
MCVGRIALGPVAERLGPAAVLSGAVAGIAAGAAMMAVPGPAIVALAGMLVVGLAAAPVFPLLTLTTAARVRDDIVDKAVGYQVAASAIGGAALPAGMGLLIQHFGATALGPVVLALALVLAFGYGLLARLTTSRDARIVQEP